MSTECRGESRQAVPSRDEWCLSPIRNGDPAQVFHRMAAVNRVLQIVVLLLFVTALSGCPDGGSGDGLDINGRPLEESGGDTGILTPNLASIQANVFTPRCALSGCHSGGSAPQGLSLDAGSSFANLVEVVSNEVPSLFRVAPGDPDASYLIRKLQGQAAVGARMPLIGPPLPQSTIDVIREWISNGAMDSAGGSITPATVIAVSPEADATLTAVPSEITVTFNQDMDRLTLNVDTIVLERSGGDGSFAEGNEVLVAITVEVSPNSRQAIIRLSGAVAGDDTYRLTLPARPRCRFWMPWAILSTAMRTAHRVAISCLCSRWPRWCRPSPPCRTGSSRPSVRSVTSTAGSPASPACGWMN